MKSRLIKILAVSIGICGLILIALPLALFDLYCSIEKSLKAQ
jgi:hypothetical protein